MAYSTTMGTVLIPFPKLFPPTQKHVSKTSFISSETITYYSLNQSENIETWCIPKDHSRNYNHELN